MQVTSSNVGDADGGRKESSTVCLLNLDKSVVVILRNESVHERAMM
jgi:hypothetical protein